MIRLFFVVTIILFSGMVCAISPVLAQNQGQNVFFEALYDVPVMPGMKEVKDEAVLFDKPDGKIAIAVAASDVITPPQVLVFYDRVLPQLGWIKSNENQYIRGKESLVLLPSEKEGVTYVRLTLSPLAAR